MPRTLPWLLNQKSETPAESDPTPRKRVKRELDSDPDQTPRRPASPNGKRDFFRSSQSPPTSPARPCPPEEFLMEGLDHDDAWIMVEDEFYAIAQSYTQHLHYAEYVRRKKEAKAQSAATMGHIQRPTDDRTAMPKEVQHKKEAEELVARQKAGLEQLGLHEEKDDSDADDDTWAGTHLHGLLTSPRKVRSLAGALALKSSTRAAAGFGQASGLNGPQQQTTAGAQVAAGSRAAEAQTEQLDEATASSEGDDLEGTGYEVSMPPTRQVARNAPGAGSGQPFQAQKTASTLGNGQAPFARTSREPSNGFKSRVQMLFDDLDELPKSSQSTASISDNVNRPSNSNRRPKSAPDNKNLSPKSTRHKDVPTFFV